MQQLLDLLNIADPGPCWNAILSAATVATATMEVKYTEKFEPLALQITRKAPRTLDPIEICYLNNNPKAKKKFTPRKTRAHVRNLNLLPMRFM